MERARGEERGPSTYELVTQRILAKLDSGVIPWRQPWSRGGGEPLSLATGKPYRGINWLLLSSSGYQSPYWLTFNEARARGGYVRPGEKGTPIVFWKIDEKEDVETGEEKKLFLLKHSTVFNGEQVENVKIPSVEGRINFEPIAVCQQLWDGWQDRPGLRYGGSLAYYAPRDDQITLPQPSQFASAETYYAVLFHESTHATGHPSRVDRGLGDGPLPPFGSPDYSREELVAEMGSAFLCAAAGIDAVTVDNAASYLQSWIRVLKGDNRLVIAVASQAQRAADYVRNLT